MGTFKRVARAIRAAGAVTLEYWSARPEAEPESKRPDQRQRPVINANSLASFAQRQAQHRRRHRHAR